MLSPQLYINQDIYLKKQKNMDNQPLANKNYDDIQSELPSNDNNPLSEEQNLWIQSFLSAQTLLKSKKEQSQVSQILQVKVIQNNQILRQNTQANIKSGCQRRRSVFHNFQKHLNVLLKKMTPFKKRNAQKSPQWHIAHKLWTLFLETHSYNKKTLRIIFGFSQDISNQQMIDEIVKQFPGLKSLYQSHSAQSVAKAQKIIRSCVVENSKFINLDNLQQKTKITSELEKFYEYFRNFIDELEEGQLKMRITKKNKNKIIKNISGNQKLSINQ